jgi:hypothetical protein
LLVTGIVSATRLVRGSIRMTAWFRSQLRNQTPSWPAAIVLATTPVSIVAMRLPVARSIRETVGSGSIAHTAPAPTASWGNPTLGGCDASVRSGSFSVRVIRVVSGSMRDTLTVW